MKKIIYGGLFLTIVGITIVGCTKEKLQQVKENSTQQSQPAPTQKAGFRVPKTVLWVIKHYFFKSSFVVKVPPFG